MKTGCPWKALSSSLPSREDGSSPGARLFPPTISTKSGCLVKNGPGRGLGALHRWPDILDTRWPLRLSPAQPPNQGSGKPDPILVPNLVWLLVTLYNPLHLCASGPTDSPAFPAFPFLAPDVGVSMWNRSPAVAPSPPRKESRKALSTPYLH